MFYYKIFIYRGTSDVLMPLYSVIPSSWRFTTLFLSDKSTLLPTEPVYSFVISHPFFVFHGVIQGDHCIIPACHQVFYNVLTGHSCFLKQVLL